MKRGTRSLVKFKRLKLRLKLPEYAAVGVLEQLWQVTLENTPAGDIGKLSNDDIAMMLEWPGDADELVSTLVETGWLDEHPEHRLVVHDWHEHAPTYLKGNFKSRSEAFASESAKGSAKHTAKGSAKGSAKQGAKRGAGAPLPIHALPSHALPDHAHPAPCRPSAGAGGGAESAAAAIAVRAGIGRSAAQNLNGTTAAQVIAHWAEIAGDSKVKRPGAVLAKRLADHDAAPPLTPAVVAAAVNAGLVKTIDGVDVAAPARFNSREVTTDDGAHRFAAGTLDTASYA